MNIQFDLKHNFLSGFVAVMFQTICCVPCTKQLQDKLDYILRSLFLAKKHVFSSHEI